MADGDAGERTVLLSIRTQTNTISNCVGTLKVRLDATLHDVRAQLVSMTSASRSKRRKHGDPEDPEPRPAPANPPPSLTQEQRERLARIRVHAFDFLSPFQFVMRGGALPLARRSEAATRIQDVFPVRPVLGDQRVNALFSMPPEVEVVTLPCPPQADAAEPAPNGRDRYRSPGRKRQPPFDNQQASGVIPDVLKQPQAPWRPRRPQGTGSTYQAFACVFVRQGDGTDTVHSEKVVMDRLLMQSNVFGRQQTPEQLGSLITKYNANTRDFLGRTILQECAQEGNYYVVAFLLGLSFVEVDAQDWKGQTALHLAVRRGHLDVVAILLDAGADILMLDTSGQSPLHVALECRSDLIVTRLCARLHSSGVTHDVLRQCKLHRSEPTVRNIVDGGYDDACRLFPDIVQALWDDGYSDAQLRAAWRNPDALMGGSGALREVLAALPMTAREPVYQYSIGDRVRSATRIRLKSGRQVERGARGEVVAVPDTQWFTPPVRPDRVAKVRFDGLTFDAKPEHVVPELVAAEADGSKDPVELFSELSPDFTSLCRAQQPQAFVALKALWHHFLFDRRLAFERQMNGRTALHEAVDACRSEVVDFLLDVVGFDISAPAVQDETKRTPMHLAAQRGATDIARRLYLQGMDPNIRDVNLCTPLHTAVYHKRWHTAEYLLVEVKDIEVDVLDVAGHTPLHIAAANNLYSVVELLLVTKRADVGLRSETVSAVCPRVPYADLTAMTTAQRCAYRRAVRGRERRWRLRSWRAKWKHLRRDPCDGRLKTMDRFDSSEQWDAAEVRPPLRELSQVDEHAQKWAPPYTMRFERLCSMSVSGPAQSVLCDKEQLRKTAPADVLVWRKNKGKVPTESHGAPGASTTRSESSVAMPGELSLPQYGNNSFISSGLGWMHDWRGQLLPRPPVVTLTLRRPDEEHGARPDFGVEWGDGMVVDRVQAGSWAERCGLGNYARLTPDGDPFRVPAPCNRWGKSVYRVTEVRREAELVKDRSGSVGLGVEQGVIRRVHPGSSAAAAGLLPGMRVIAVNGHRPGGTPVLSAESEGAFEAAVAAAASPLTLTVAVSVSQPDDVDSLDATAVEVLLTAGAQPTWRSRLRRPRRQSAQLRTVQGPTALSCAVACGCERAPTSLLLLENGAGRAHSDSPEVLSLVASRAIDDCNFEVAVQLLRLLRRETAGEVTLLHRYVESGNNAAVRWLVEQGAPLDRAGVGKFSGLTPLCVASRRGDHRCISFLIQQGADITAGAGSAGDPLVAAIEGSHEDVLSLLIHFGAKVNEPGPPPLRRPPLHVACALGALDMVKGLVLKGEINATSYTADGAEATALWVALEEGPPRCRSSQSTAVRRRCARVPEHNALQASELPHWMLRRPPKPTHTGRRAGPGASANARQKSRGADAYEAVAVFLCVGVRGSKRIDIASGPRHVLDYVDLAAAKGYWEAVAALLQTQGGAVLDRPPPYSGAAGRVPRPDADARRRHPGVAAGRDAVSYAAEDGRVDVLRHLLLDWGVRPSNAPEVGCRAMNAIDHAFAAGSLDPCLMLLSRGILPARLPRSEDRDVRALAGTLRTMLDSAWRPSRVRGDRPAIRVIAAMYGPPVLSVPAAPVDILSYSSPGFLEHVPQAGDFVRVLVGDEHLPGRVEVAGTAFSVVLEGGRRLEDVSFDEDSRKKYRVGRDTGVTLPHLLASRGLLSQLRGLLHYTKAHPQRERRFDSLKHDRGTAAGTLLYAAAYAQQVKVAEHLMEHWGATACVVNGKSPLVAAVCQQQLSMVQKIVEGGAPDINAAAVPDLPPTGTAALRSLEAIGMSSKGSAATPLYLSAALLNYDITAYLLRHQARATRARFFVAGEKPEEVCESPLHAVLVAAPATSAAVVGTVGSAFETKRATTKAADVVKIAGLLVDAAAEPSVATESSRSPVAGPKGETAAPTHVMNIAAEKGYWGVLDRLLTVCGEAGRGRHGAGSVDRAIMTAIGAVSDAVAVRRPHVLHFLAAAGELELLARCIQRSQRRTGDADVCLPQLLADKGHTAVMRFARSNGTVAAHGVGSTADWAAWGGQAACLMLLLSRGCRLSRHCSDMVPRGVSQLRFRGFPATLRSASRRPRRKGEVRGLPPSAPRRLRGDGWNASVARQLLTVADEVESASAKQMGWTYLHALVVRPGCQAALAILVEALSDPGALGVQQLFKDPCFGSVSPLWLAVRAGNAAAVAQLCRSPAHAGERSGLPWSVLQKDEAVFRALVACDRGRDRGQPCDVDAADDLWLPSATRRQAFGPLQRFAAPVAVPFGSTHTITAATATFLACLHGMEEQLKALRSNGADFKNDATTARPLVRVKKRLMSRAARVRGAPRANLSDDEAEREPVLDRLMAHANHRHRLLCVRNKVTEARPEDLKGGIGELQAGHPLADVTGALVSSFGSIELAFRSMCTDLRSAKGQVVRRKELIRGLRQAGVPDRRADQVADLLGATDDESAVRRGTWRRALSWRTEAADSEKPRSYTADMAAVESRPELWSPGWGVDEQEADDLRPTGVAISLRPIWGIIDGVPNHPLMITVKRKLETARGQYDPVSKRKGTSLRETCDRYARMAEFVVRRNGLSELTAEQITLLVLIAASKGHWVIADLLLKEGASQLQQESVQGGAAAAQRDPRFLCEVKDEFAAVWAGVTKRHPIHVAAEHVSRDFFMLFVNRSRKEDVEHLPDPRGFTALHCAIMVSNVGVVELLLQRGVDIEVRGGPLPRCTPRLPQHVPAPDLTALMIAARFKNLSIVTRLLKAGADKEAVDRAGNTPLIHACEMGHLAIVDALVSAQVQVGTLNHRGYSAVMRACARGHDDVACPMLEHWTRTGGLASQTTSVLHCAAEGGCDGVVEHLVSGAWEKSAIRVLERDRNPDSAPLSPLWISWALGRTFIKRNLYRLLQQKEAEGYGEESEGSDARLLATMAADSDAQAEELQAEGELLPGWMRDSLLMSAKIRQRLAGAQQPHQLPKELTYAAASPPLRVQLRGGCTLFRLRSLRQDPRVELMGTAAPTGPAAHKALRKAAESWGLLEWAARANNAVAVKILADHCLYDNCNALHLAAERGNLDVVQILLQLQMSSVSAEDSRGRSAMVRALQSRKQKVAVFLMSKMGGKRILRQTPEGQSLLHLCAIYGMEEAAVTLLGSLEKRLRGADTASLSLHQFIHAPDRHPELENWDSEEEEPDDEDPEVAETLARVVEPLLDQYGSVRTAFAQLSVPIRGQQAEGVRVDRALQLAGVGDAAQSLTDSVLRPDGAGMVDLEKLFTAEDKLRRAGHTTQAPGVPPTGFTPFEYALMFGNPAVALRLAFSSRSRPSGAEDSIRLNPRFPGPNGCELPVMSCAIRAMISELFDDPSRGPDAGPFVIRGDLVKHPGAAAPSRETGQWPRDGRRVRFERMTWPDVRVAGIARLRETPWIAEKLDDIITLDHERQRYHSLLETLDLHGRAFRLNYASLNVDGLAAAERLMVLQHVGPSLIVGRYTQRDNDWTRPPAGGEQGDFDWTRPPGRKRSRKQQDGSPHRGGPRAVVGSDGLAGQVSCVQLEYTADRAQVGVSVDNEGVVHERFALSEDSLGRRVLLAGSVDTAMELHFRRREAEAKREADRILAHVQRRLRGTPLPPLRVVIDWRSVDKYRFATPRDRLLLLESLGSPQGVWTIVEALEAVAPGISSLTKAAEQPKDDDRTAVMTGHYTSIVFRRALWNEGTRGFYVHQQEGAEEARSASATELVVHFDARMGEVHYTRATQALRPLLALHEADVAKREIESKLEVFRKRLEPHIDLKCKVEQEGGWIQRMDGTVAAVPVHQFCELLREIEEELKSVMAPRGAAASVRRASESGEWVDLSASDDRRLTPESLLRAATRQHVRAVGVLISPRREPTCKLAAAPNRTLIACVKCSGGELTLPSSRQVSVALRTSVMEFEVSALREQMSLTLSDVQQRLQAYLPASLVVDWRSFDDLSVEDRFVAVGVFCHGRGQRVLNPLVSGLSIGWDSRLGSVVQKHVSQVTVHCSLAERSRIELMPSGTLKYHAALLSEATNGGALLSTQEIASEIMILLDQKEEAHATEVLLRDPSAVLPDRNVAQHVDAGKAFPCWTHCRGAGLRTVAAGAGTTFFICTRNILNQPCVFTHGPPQPEPLSARVTPIHDGHGPESAEVTVEAGAKPGEYKATYTAPTKAGSYLLHVFLSGVHVARSPYRVVVKPSELVAAVRVPEKFDTVVCGRPVVLKFVPFDEYGNRTSFRSGLPRAVRVAHNIATACSASRNMCKRHAPALAAAIRDAMASPTYGSVMAAALTGIEAGWNGYRFKGQLTPAKAQAVAGALRESARQAPPLSNQTQGELPCRDLVLDGVAVVRSKGDVRMKTGQLVRDGDGAFSVRTVPTECGECSLTLCIGGWTPSRQQVTVGGRELACSVELTVVQPGAALGLAQEHSLKHWERNVRKRQMAELERPYARAWFKDSARNAPPVVGWREGLRANAPLRRCGLVFHPGSVVRQPRWPQVSPEMWRRFLSRDADEGSNDPGGLAVVRDTCVFGTTITPGWYTGPGDPRVAALRRLRFREAGGPGRLPRGEAELLARLLSRPRVVSRPMYKQLTKREEAAAPSVRPRQDTSQFTKSCLAVTGTDEVSQYNADTHGPSPPVAGSLTLPIVPSLLPAPDEVEAALRRGDRAAVAAVVRGTASSTGRAPKRWQ